MPEGIPATPPYIGMPKPPPVIFYRRTQLVHLQGRAPSTPLYIENVHAASDRLLSGHPAGASTKRGARHSSLKRHGHISSGGLLEEHPVVAYRERDTYNAFLYRICPGNLHLPPTGPPSGCITKKGAHATLSHIGSSLPPLVISFRRTQVVHITGGVLDTPPYTGSVHVTLGHLLPVHRVGTSPGRRR